MNIRIASAQDCEALRAIYAQYIDTAVTFEYTLPTAREFAARMTETLAEYPYLVCEDAGGILGYCYAHRAQTRAAYQWNAEASIYLDKRCTGFGLGGALYRALIALLTVQGIKVVYGCVTNPNPQSEALHERLGFTRIGLFPKAGYKCGAWHDVIWFQKELAPHADAPAPVTPFSALPRGRMEAILHDGLECPLQERTKTAILKEKKGGETSMDFYEIFDKIARNEITCAFGIGNAGARSRFGGQPEVPEGFQWPYFGWQEEQMTVCMRADGAPDTQETTYTPVRKPLAFLAQFDCAELSAYDSAHELPASGVLSFFYELDSQRWGFDPEDAGCARVYWFEDADALHPADFPEDLEEAYRLPALPVRFAQRMGLPDFDEFSNGQDGDCDAYEEDRALWGWELPGDVCSKLLGYADIIQGDMRWECVRVTNGIYCGGLDEGDPDKLAALRGQETAWRLLFQLDTVESDGFTLMFGDCGRIYFYIRQDDLENRRFDKAWLILQCC